MSKQFSTVNIREPQQKKKVAITSLSKPELQANIINKWQSLIDLTAKVANVPSGLIMKLNAESIEVFLKSDTEGNPYEKGEQAKLVYGLYCETVIGTQEKLLVPDATKSKIWKDDNPDIDINMISYLGFPINWPDGEVFGTVCLLDKAENSYNETINALLFELKQHIETDLELHVTKQQLENTNKELEEINATKDKFFSIISHDLRGPFNALLGFSNKLITKFDRYDTAKKKKMIGAIDDTVKSAYNLFESLLTWSRTQRGKIDYKPQKKNLYTLVEDTIKLLTQSASNKLISISNTISPTIEADVDENMMQTVIRNLISNAVKFTPKRGKIDISAHTVEENGKNYVQVEVKDSGIGIKDEIMEQLFKISGKVSTKGTENETGTGLGLIICKEFVEQHGGRIWAESNINEGTSFNFTIQAGYELEDNILEHDKVPVILVAEDEDVNFMYMETIFEDFEEDHGLVVKLVRAENGLEAVDLFKSKQIDLVLMDIRMPEMDGYEALKAIKSINQNIPVIAQSAFIDDEESCLSQGFDGFIGKPIQEPLLLKIINEHLS